MAWPGPPSENLIVVLLYSKELIREHCFLLSLWVVVQGLPTEEGDPTIPEQDRS